MRTAFGFPLCVAVIAVGSGAFVAGGQDIAQQGQQAATFRVGTQLVQIDVRVTDREGRFTRGLSGEDFEILEDGEPQWIAFFSFVDIPVMNKADRTLASASATRPDDGDKADGRTYVMLLDGPAGGPDHVQRMRSVARLFLDQAFGPADRMAVTFAKGKFRAQAEMTEQGFTTTRRAIEAAVDRLAPETRGTSGSGADSVVNTYRAIEDISERLGTMLGGRRSAIVWVGGVVPFNPAERFPKHAAEIGVAYLHAIRAANRHNVAIYPVDLRGLTNRLSPPQAVSFGRSGEELKRMSALRVVAEDTGGEAVVGTNNYAEMFGRIASHTSTYYLLGYQPAVVRCDGRFHAITVRVKQAGAAVTARRGYFAPEANKSAALCQ
jgi:VWFA-related protein